MKLTKVTSILSLTAGLVLFSACKKDDVTPTGTTPVTYTPEQNKANLQSTGQSAIKAMDDMKTMPSLDNTAHFVALVDAKNPFGDNAKPSGIMPIKVMYALDAFNKNGKHAQLINTLRDLKTLDSNTVEFQFNQIAGTYDWNQADSTWKKTPGTDLVLNFPGTKSSVTNDCSYSVSYKGYTGTSLINSGNTPEKIVAKLTVKNDVLVQFNFDGAYDATNGVPTSLEANLNIKPYNLNTKLTISSTDVAYSYAFTHNADNILAVGASLKGEFTKAHLESLQDSSAIKGVQDLSKIATNVNFYFQVMNVKLDAKADVATLSDDVKNLGGQDKMNMTQAAAELNKNVSIKLYYTDKNVNIAHAEFYQYLNTNNNNSDDMNVRLVFDDASKTDVETYFKTGFEGLQADFESFQTAMMDKFK
jgi:hypothetical protein